MSKRKADFYLLGTAGVSTVFVLTPRSRAARKWRREYLPEDVLTWGKDGIAVEHRFISDILDGIEEAGLTVEGGA